jgi:hypothetical protein
MLILNNASVPVNNEPETYISVMKAWTAALEPINNLVNGIPQRVQDGAALLGISSWHLSPDMRVYGASCAEVKQKVPIFSPTAVLTLGLQHVRDDTKSVLVTTIGLSAILWASYKDFSHCRTGQLKNNLPTV